MKKNIPAKTLENGFSMPEYGLGTHLMGGRRERDYDNDDKANIQAIRDAIDNGVTHIDTAEVYAGGYSEVLVSQAIKPYNRADLFIVSKVSPWNFYHNNLVRSCENSLDRLGIDYLDLYLLHRYSPDISLKETIGALDYLVERKLIKNIGVSNFSVEHLKEAQSYSQNKIVVNQVHYNLQVREPETKGLLAFCQTQDIFLEAWRPIGINMNKGDYLTSVPDILQKLVDKYQKTPIQIVLNWLVSQKNVITLSKTTSKDHLEENLGAFGWYMSDEDIEDLRKNYPDRLELSNVINLE